MVLWLKFNQIKFEYSQNMSVKIKTVSMQSAMSWYAQAWQIFKLQSNLFMLGVFLMFLSKLTIIILGIFGVVFDAVFTTFILAGFFHVAYRAKHQTASQRSHLFAAFKDKQIQVVLIQIGLIKLVVSLLGVPNSNNMYNSLMANGTVAPLDLAFAIGLNAAYFLFTFYAVPLAFFHHETRLKVLLLTSFKATTRNLPALIIFMFFAVFMVFLTVSLTLGLALIVVMPWLLIISFLSFNEIIGADSDLPPPVTDDGNSMMMDA